ncbi:MAG TPA: DMT family transporter [Mycobacteriales bacterium]|jgi:drug/metabolite transporter (DMT)-like permease|nr:DMT family transporter [Mycobacteriales bacterium]
MMVILLAFAASLCYAAGFVMQYHEAHEAPERLFLSPRLLIELCHHKIWVLGIVVMLVGSGLQAWALDSGSLAVVEPILTCSLLFALPLSAAWRRERLRRSEWLGALMISAGLGVLLGVGSPTIGNPDMAGYQWLLVVAATCGAAALMVTIGRGSARPSARAALVGGAAGVLFGLQDVLTHYCLHALSHDPTALLTAWQPYLLIVSGIYGLVLAQSAYEAGPLTAGLPPIAIGEPIVGMLIGMFALNERLDASTVALVVESVGAAVMITGTWLLARSPLVCGGRHPSRLETAQTAARPRTPMVSRVG